ncbi:unnamed protein product [Rangifer tarandus platyrhynchus]|uniref:Uncharacterized protein n=2 Tax=Rangifer tarandus platyrhynchus TaxID=3082113 RepID=A0ABN8YTE8_RANTA|nr:unnamed protein product [Rangifer tarandus platyrhynchus]CAI9702429.1 unnamed protein product [Rangifer tarandus platyrhynchus]
MTGCQDAAWIEAHENEPPSEMPASQHTRERLDSARIQTRTRDSPGVATHSSDRDRRNHAETQERVSRPLPLPPSPPRDHTTWGPFCWTRVPPTPDPRPGRAPASSHRAHRATERIERVQHACRDRKPHRGQNLPAAARSPLQAATPRYRTPSGVVTQGAAPQGDGAPQPVRTRAQSRARAPARRDVSARRALRARHDGGGVTAPPGSSGWDSYAVTRTSVSFQSGKTRSYRLGA